eukprot:871533-Pleurochrysis_carterae.AAC.2
MLLLTSAPASARHLACLASQVTAHPSMQGEPFGLKKLDVVRQLSEQVCFVKSVSRQCAPRRRADPSKCFSLACKIAGIDSEKACMHHGLEDVCVQHRLRAIQQT